MEKKIRSTTHTQLKYKGDNKNYSSADKKLYDKYDNFIRQVITKQDPETGNLISEFEPYGPYAGRELYYSYDKDNNLIDVVDKKGDKIFSYEYDSNGNEIKKISYNPSRKTYYESTSDYFYNDNGSYIKVKRSPVGMEVFVYDEKGNCRRHYTKDRTIISDYTYDDLDRLVMSTMNEIKVENEQNENKIITQYSYYDDTDKIRMRNIIYDEGSRSTTYFNKSGFITMHEKYYNNLLQSEEVYSFQEDDQNRITEIICKVVEIERD